MYIFLLARTLFNLIYFLQIFEEALSENKLVLV